MAARKRRARKKKGGGVMRSMRGNLRQAARAAAGKPTKRTRSTPQAIVMNVVTFLAIAVVVFLLVRGC